MNGARAALRALVPVAVIATLVSVPVSAHAAVTYTVNSTADTTDGTCSGPGNAVTTGDCTLREAILNANSNAGNDTIDFNLSGSAPYTITVGSQLPNVTGGVLLDGTSQPGYSTSPIVIVSGNHTVSVGFHLTDNGGSSIRGLSIVGFTDNAIETNSGGHSITGNYIGLLPDGSTADANGNGVFLFSSTVGGTGPADRNVISGNVNSAVYIVGGGSQVLGNYLGTDASGTVAVANQVGVTINGGGSNTIGGNDPSKGNVISGNAQGGIVISGNSGAVAQNNTVQNNLIGVDAGGSASLPNGGNGIWLPNYATGTTIGEANTGGGFAAATGPNGNVIANNDGAGVSIGGVGTSRNTVSQNSIYANAGLGIDLNSDGVTNNDDDIGGNPQTPDTDTGPNGLQNWPELGAVQVDTSEGIHVITSGDLYSTPDTSFTIDYYSSNSCDGSGNGEGRFFEGAFTVTTDANGHADVAESLSPTTGSQLTATATNQTTGDTSEFSNCAHVPQQIDADLGVSKSDAAPNGPDPVMAGNNVGYQIDVTNHGPDDSTGVAVTDDIPPEATFVSATGDGWSCDYDSGTHTAFCQRSGLQAGQTSSITVVVKSPNTPPSSCPADSGLSSCITDSATVDFLASADDQFDPNPDNNTATESTEVQPKPANPDDSTGFVSPDGGTVTTGNNPTATDNTDASVTLPPGGPGGVVDIHEQTPPPNLCVNGCTGQAVEIDIPNGYDNPSQPPRVVLKYDVTVVRPKGGAKIYIKKGDNAPFLVPTCLQHGVADPSPCVGSRQRLANGDLRVTVLLLSGDPLCGKH